MRENPGGPLLIPSCLARHSFLGFLGKVCEGAVAKQLQDTSGDWGGAEKKIQRLQLLQLLLPPSWRGACQFPAPPFPHASPPLPVASEAIQS